MPSVKVLPGLADDYTSQFCVGDIVYFRSDPELRAFVARTWATEDDDDLEGFDPLDRPLLLGEVGLRVGVQGKRAIEPESTLELLNRTVVLGDLVKQDIASPQVAIVLSTHTEVQVETALECINMDTWIPVDRMTSAARFREGDRVVSGGWLGTITVVGQVGLAKLRNGTSYLIHDTYGIMTVGDKVSDVVEQYKARGITMASREGGSENDRVCAAAPYGVEVSWLAMNQKIPISEEHKYPMPQFWYQHAEFDKLVRIGKALDKFPQIGRSYVFKDERDYERYGLPARYGGATTGGTIPLRITRFRIKARLQWPDGHITEEWANSVVRHDNLDEHESWPGQHVFVSDDDANQKRSAVVQRYDPVQRIVDIRFSDTAEIRTVSVLEVKHHDEDHDDYGAALGECVFLCDDNGSPMPYVPAIGQAPVVHANSVELLKWAIEKQSTLIPKTCEWSGAVIEANDVDWIGEVISLEMDGRIGVRLANGSTTIVELRNVQMLKFGEGEFDDVTDGTPSVMGSDDPRSPSPPYQGPINDLAAIVLANARRQRSANNADDGGSDASWETQYSDDDDDADIRGVDMFPTMRPDIIQTRRTQLYDEINGMSWTPEDGSAPPTMDLDNASEDADWVDESIEMAPSSPPTRQSRSPSPPSMTDKESSPQAGPSSAPRDVAWEPFVVLETAPRDHRYFSQPPAPSSRARMKKINAEHKTLRSSLPDNILVRSYEDRLDLMRVLIIGPEGTPYAGAPFVFDVFLHPGYPSEPPTVFFHSQTNGKGRCNPNLYEEGKVCLSILGTWAGDASESWNAERSSLLQVFVSISGLVLVRNPYHCEPAYAKLEGTKEGSVNSRLYSEKAYVLSRGFVKQALAYPPEGLQDEIRHYYYTTGHLKDVVDHARVLMERYAEVPHGDEGGARWNADVIGDLTAGAKLSLKRVFLSLEKSWEDYIATTT